MVLAGAVAVAIAPRTMENSQFRWNITFKSSVTSIPAKSASLIVMTIILFPVRISTSFLKNFPTPNAINANARSLTKLIPLIIFSEIKFRPHGPIKIPARIYPLTFGIFKVFVSLVMIKPANNMIESVKSTPVSSFN